MTPINGRVEMSMKLITMELHNGPTHIEYGVLCNILVYSMEEKFDDLFTNYQNNESIKITFKNRVWEAIYSHSIGKVVFCGRDKRDHKKNELLICVSIGYTIK